jgi:hypothetical protein
MPFNFAEYYVSAHFETRNLAIHALKMIDVLRECMRHHRVDRTASSGK